MAPTLAGVPRACCFGGGFNAAAAPTQAFSTSIFLKGEVTCAQLRVLVLPLPWACVRLSSDLRSAHGPVYQGTALVPLPFRLSSVYYDRDGHSAPHHLIYTLSALQFQSSVQLK